VFNRRCGREVVRQAWQNEAGRDGGRRDKRY
jgi:hypothetical protein